MTSLQQDALAHDFVDDEAGPDLGELLAPVVARWKTILGVAIVCGALGLAGSYLVTPRFTATCVFLPPQGQQGGAAAALASLGALSSLVGAGTGAHNTPDEYIAFMQSVTISDRIVKKFGLMKLYKADHEIDARNTLAASVKITAGKKANVIEIDVTDKDPVLAAAIANQYIDELRTLTNGLAVTEAQQRRLFFEHLLEQTRDKLAAAQFALESSGYSSGALNVEPRTAAEGYAHVRADLTAAEIKLQVLRETLADTSPQVRVQQETINALNVQIAKFESQAKGQTGSSDYINRYREFKYQETLFDLFSRQYESARVDESREGSLIQVIDPATPPELKSAPSRKLFALGAGVAGFLFSALYFGFRRRRAA